MKLNKKGFTLIELLVVIAIIGLLAGIVLVSLGGARESAQDARRQTDIRNIGTAMELCYEDSTCGGIGGGGESNAYISQITMPAEIGSHMPSVPGDPISTGSCAGFYCWKQNAADPQTYCAYAQLSSYDGAVGGGDDYFCTSEHGVATERDGTVVPELTDCCGL
jgi:prepilin-type N-terminal cleavage/methylation domain-containing protein